MMQGTFSVVVLHLEYEGVVTTSYVQRCSFCYLPHKVIPGKKL